MGSQCSQDVASNRELIEDIGVPSPHHTPLHPNSNYVPSKYSSAPVPFGMNGPSLLQNTPRLLGGQGPQTPVQKQAGVQASRRPGPASRSPASPSPKPRITLLLPLFLVFLLHAILPLLCGQYPPSSPLAFLLCG